MTEACVELTLGQHLLSLLKTGNLGKTWVQQQPKAIEEKAEWQKAPHPCKKMWTIKALTLKKPDEIIKLQRQVDSHFATCDFLDACVALAENFM
jgi:hypothetical protein